MFTVSYFTLMAMKRTCSEITEPFASELIYIFLSLYIYIYIYIYIASRIFSITAVSHSSEIITTIINI